MRTRILAIAFAVLGTIQLGILVSPVAVDADGGDSDYQFCVFTPGPHWAIISRFHSPPDSIDCVAEVSLNVILEDSIPVCSAPEQYPHSSTAAASAWNDALLASAGHAAFYFETNAAICRTPQNQRFEPGVLSVVVTDNYPGGRLDTPLDSASSFECFAGNPLQDRARGCYVPQNIWGHPLSSTSDTISADGAPWNTAVGQTEIRLNPAFHFPEDDNSFFDRVQITETITHELGHVLGFADRSEEEDCGADDPTSTMGYGVCHRGEPTADDVAQYVLIYAPDAPSGFSGSRVAGKSYGINFTWTASHVRVEKEFRIDRHEEPMGVPIWVPVITVPANEAAHTITDRMTEPKTYRVVAVTGAPAGTAGDAASNTFTVPGIDVTLSAFTASGTSFTFAPATTMYRFNVSSSLSRNVLPAPRFSRSRRLPAIR